MVPSEASYIPSLLMSPTLLTGSGDTEGHLLVCDYCWGNERMYSPSEKQHPLFPWSHRLDCDTLRHSFPEIV